MNNTKNQSKEHHESSENKLEVIATFPIYKPLRRLNHNFKKAIHKRLKRLNKGSPTKYDPVVEELNQFLFSSIFSERNDLQKIENRKKLERDLVEIHRNFSDKTLKELRKLIKGDPELRISSAAFQDIDKLKYIDIETVMKKINNFPSTLIQQLSLLFEDSLLILWDLPGDEIDRIIIGGEVINRENDTLDVLDIGVIADELALAALGKNHVPLLLEQTRNINQISLDLKESLTIFDEGFLSIKDDIEQSLLVEIASVLMGKLLGIREPLLLAENQLKRYLQLEADIQEEGQKIGSRFLEDLYSKIIDSSQIHNAIEILENILSNISDNAEIIRKLYHRIETAEPVGRSSHLLQKFVHYVSLIYYTLEDFRFITEVFQDIPSYTSMGGGVAIEADQEQEISIPSGYSIFAENVFKTFPLISNTVYALRGVDLSIKDGEFVAIMGPSGSGKTTLLNILSGLDFPDRGTVWVEGLDLRSASESQLVQFRRDIVSFIYQSYNLLPNLRNLENVKLPSDFGTSNKLGNRRKRASELIERVGLDYYKRGFPLLLSGGQQQRVTIARALMNKPKILFADEPTGDLDTTTGSQVMDVIEQLRSDGMTIVLVTHDKEIASRADRIIQMRDGKIVNEV